MDLPVRLYAGRAAVAALGRVAFRAVARRQDVVKRKRDVVYLSVAPD